MNPQTGTDRGPTDSVATDRSGHALLWVMAALLVVLVIRLAMPDPFDGPVDGPFGVIAVLFPLIVCVVAVRRSGVRRSETLLAAAAVAAFSGANMYYAVAQTMIGTVPVPSPADIGYTLFYPLMLGALAVLVRKQAAGHMRAVWLDSVLGSLGAASVLAVLLSPVLDAASQGPHTAASVVSVAMPLFDLLLVATVVGIASSRTLDLGPRWTVLVLGLLVFAATDVVFALWVAEGTYQFGTPLNAGWAVGLALVAVWVEGVARSGRRSHRVSRRPPALAIPVLATASGLAVLVLGTQVHLSVLAVALAGVTLIAAAARTHIAYRQLVSMADLRRQARTDDLTGLPNRRTLYADVPDLLAAEPDRPSALLLLDLDRFKEVNDSLGHHAGDRLLIQVGTRLALQLQPGDLLARLGGDEFAILLADADGDRAVTVARELRTVLAEPFILEGIALQTGVSVGIALYPDQGDDLNALLRRADMAMYRAKSGHVGYHVFATTDDTRSEVRLRTLDELRTALAVDQLVLHYQPKVALETGAVTGVEALVRWNHPQRGLLMPDSFLDLVEDAGLMQPMTLVVLAKALDQAALWVAAGAPLRVAVNLSASSLIDAELPGQVAAMIAVRGLTPSALMLEITEDSLMADRDRARSVLTQLREHGIEIAIDDFGSGYSSLAYLRDLPIDELKLDRSFIAPMDRTGHAAALVASTIALAHSLDLRMVAEGVETRLAYDELARHGCDQAQGFYLSRPVPAATLDSWLAERCSVAGMQRLAALR